MISTICLLLSPVLANFLAKVSRISTLYFLRYSEVLVNLVVNSCLRELTFTQQLEVLVPSIMLFASTPYLMISDLPVNLCAILWLSDHRGAGSLIVRFTCITTIIQIIVIFVDEHNCSDECRLQLKKNLDINIIYHGWLLALAIAQPMPKPKSSLNLAYGLLYSALPLCTTTALARKQFTTSASFKAT